MELPSSTLEEGDGDRTFAAVVVIDVDEKSDIEDVATVLRALAARGTEVAVLHEGLGDAIRSSPVGPGERFLLQAEGGDAVVELTAGGIRRLWSVGEGGPAGALDYVVSFLAQVGIHPGLALIVGTHHSTPRGSTLVDGRDVLRSLRHQVERIDSLRVPLVGDEPSWTMRFDPTRLPLRVRETLCTVANGHIGVRGSAEEEPPGSDPLVVAAGVYDDQDPPSLLEGPRWTQLPAELGESKSDEWLLDMRGGVLARRRALELGTVVTLRLVSLERPHCAVLLAEWPETVLADDRLGTDGLVLGGQHVSDATAESSRGRISARASERVAPGNGICALERIVAYETSSSRLVDPDDRANAVARLSALGSHRILSEHRSAWARRWRSASVSISGDPETEQAVRFALFHLLGSAAPEGESAVGARGLTGRAYRGHVFWDTDVFVLPALAATLPEAARATLEYRVARLPAAREEARRRGFEGARFPWESADDGHDVTPRRLTNTGGEVIEIRTGLREEHIVADVAWAARHYAMWTDDWEFLLRGTGRHLIDETARYWASRMRVDSNGHGHIDDVIGPDEYHEMVDDNAFTNVMARANLRWAIGIGRIHGGADADELSTWSDLAGRLVDGYDPETGIYEQFAGYDDLAPLLVEEVARPPIAADLLLGRRTVAASQLIKQADVLMLHHMVPEEVAEQSLVPNLNHYFPRTAHGSSLSPAIHASLLARAGRVEEALTWFRMASRLDLDDLTGTTAGGIHLATMGGLWQALAFGFLGLGVKRRGIQLDPRLPQDWSSLAMSLTALQSPLEVRATPEEVEIESDRPLYVSCGEAQTRARVVRARFSRVSGTWKENT